MRGVFFLLMTFFSFIGFCQSVNPFDSATSLQQALENISESVSADEDDYFIQQLEVFKKNPINLNTATGEELSELLLLHPLQIENLISYRKLFGFFINFYELQAVPYWDTETIRKLKPFISTSTPVNLKNIFRERFKMGEYSFMARTNRIVEKSKGFFINPDSSDNGYAGSPQRLAIRFKYNYKNLLQYGIVAEKDPGEEFFKNSQRKGFDFYSAHLMVKNIGCIKALVIGDYSVVMGQGLIQCQGLAFKKGVDLFSAKRQSPLLRPYNSFGETNFHRGAGAIIGFKNVSFGFFVSYRRLDGNLIKDSLNPESKFITSLQTSGLHRTDAELADKSVVKKITFGGNLKFLFKKGHLALNAIQHAFDIPLIKDSKPYNLFQFSGSKLNNYSIDYSYTVRNFHFFGEAAISNYSSPACIAGLFMSASSNTDISFIYRNISRSFHSIYSSAFTENSTVNNEQGLFTGISIRPHSRWQIDTYCDVFKFPWLKYGIDSKSFGTDCLVQVTYKPNRSIELYSRYKYELKVANDAADGTFLSTILPFLRKSFRLNLNYKINKSFIFRSRVEMLRQQSVKNNSEEGFLLSADLHYKPLMKPVSANCRLLFFETSSYNTRLYAYESDVLYNYSIPVIYGKGVRYYLNFNIDYGKSFSIWLRWAQTIFSDKSDVGSGLDAISGNVRSEYKCQFLYRF